jgi:regulator of protease activity HflC (stomatin/prohibitin superfamily)
VQSVEIRDVIIPVALEDAMSRQAQAERERQARIILGTAETEIAHKFVEAADAYRDHPVALNLRAMNMLYESIAKRGSLMVVPSGLADSLNVPSIMGVMGATGLAPHNGVAGLAMPADGEPDAMPKAPAPTIAPPPPPGR